MTAFKNIGYYINYNLLTIYILNQLQMSYKVILLDRDGNESPAMTCEVHCDGTEIEVDAEIANEYINCSHMANLIDGDEIISVHHIHGYCFYGDTIINGVNASRCGQYILAVSSAI